jgi:AP-1 complex subunit beta-1
LRWGHKTGENHELREELRSPNREVRRDAVKKVIANMTVGKDVSTLFTEVINCIQTGKGSNNILVNFSDVWTSC